jgi:hypothetical protein
MPRRRLPSGLLGKRCSCSEKCDKKDKTGAHENRLRSSSCKDCAAMITGSAYDVQPIDKNDVSQQDCPLT